MLSNNFNRANAICIYSMLGFVGYTQGIIVVSYFDDDDDGGGGVVVVGFVVDDDYGGDVMVVMMIVKIYKKKLCFDLSDIFVTSYSSDSACNGGGGLCLIYHIKI